jgi:transcription elongation factor Elf1
MARGPQGPDKRTQRETAEQTVREFLARGGSIKRGPDVVPTQLTCRSCGAVSVIGIAEGQRRSARCPKCGVIAG